MFSLSKQERLALLVLAMVILSGSCLELLFKKCPWIKDSVNLMEGNRVYSKIDVNTASLEELVSVPYIGEYTARKMIDHREEYGPFASLEQLKTLPGIKEGNYAVFSKFLKISKLK